MYSEIIQVPTVVPTVHANYYAVIHDCTCTSHPMILILHVVEFSFTKNTNIFFKEVNMYIVSQTAMKTSWCLKKRKEWHAQAGKSTCLG